MGKLKIICGNCVIEVTKDRLVFRNTDDCEIGVKAGLITEEKWRHVLRLKPEESQEFPLETGRWEVETAHIMVPTRKVQDELRKIAEEASKDEFFSKLLNAFDVTPEKIAHSFAEGVVCHGHEAEFEITA